MKNKSDFLDTSKFFKSHLKIRTKKSELVPFELNTPQIRLNELVESLERKNVPIRIIILKARQMGFSTYVEGYIFKKAITNFNTYAGIITHKEDATKNLFTMTSRFYQNMDKNLRPELKASNAKELIFDNKEGTGMNSRIACMTAGADGTGRSDTFQYLHISEFSHWPGNKMSTLGGLVQSVPAIPNSAIFIESTANGFNEFKTLWDSAVKGDSGYIPIFFPWFEDPENKWPYNGFTLTDEEEEMKNRFNLTNEQISWRRYKIKTECFGDEQLFKQEYPSFPEEAFITSGTSVFDSEKIIARMRLLSKPKKRGYFTYVYDGTSIEDICFVENEKGCIKIYEEPMATYPYVIGGDTAGDGSDSFTGQVINNITSKQTAVLKMDSTDEDLYSYQIYCLGIYYNSALLGIESNFSTYPIKEIQRLDYPNIYVRETEDDYTGKLQRKYGFRTTTVTRPIIIASLIKIFRESPECFTDRETLEEMLTFVRSSSGKPEAMSGSHDDLVMALAIVYYVRNEQSFIREEKFVREKTIFDKFISNFENDNDKEEGDYIKWD